MRITTDLSFNENGFDRVDYSVFKKKNTFIAKVNLILNNKRFFIQKKSDDLGELNKKVSISVKNLRSKILNKVLAS